MIHSEKEMTMFDMQNKVAVVTGGAQGIGKCIDGGMTRHMIYHGWWLNSEKAGG